jgi:hypothetical protein
MTLDFPPPCAAAYNIARMPPEPEMSSRSASFERGTHDGALLGKRLAFPLSLLGALTLVVSAFLPQRSLLGNTLWREGTGWGIVAAALLLVGFTWRAHGRGRISWAGLWVGGLATLNALALAGDHKFRPLGAGVYALGLGGLLVLAGWLLAFLSIRPAIAGWVGWRALLRVPARQEPSPRSTGLSLPSIEVLGSPAVWSLGLYAVASFVFWGAPVLGHFHTTLIAENDIDPAQYTWFYSWWPHAVFGGHNPFITKIILAPDGYNLSWATAVPAPSLLSSPINALFGAVVTYNVLALAAPVLASWTAFLLCRHVSRALAPSLLGGFIFGFSPYMLRMLQGSPDLYFVALVPVLVLLVVRHLEGSLSDRRFLLGMTVTLALQFVTTVELVATTSIFGAVALAAGFILWPERRRRLAHTIHVLAFAYIGAAILVSPMIFFMLFHGHTTPYNNGPLLSADLLSWIYPDPALAVATTHQIAGAPGYYGGLAYFTVPLLLVIGAWTWERRRVALGRLLAICFIVPAVFGLGSLLRVRDHLTHIGLPWAVLAHFPGLRLLIPQRFAMFAFLSAAVIVAMWLARRRGALRWSLALLAVVLMVPNIGSRAWKTPINDPPFFTNGQYAAYLHPSDRVLTVPIIGENMRWQAEDHFRYQLAGGGLGTFPSSYTRYAIFTTLLSGRLAWDYQAQLRRFIKDKGVTAVVIDKHFLGQQWLKLFGSLGVRPVDTGGVLLYRLSGS